MCQPVLNPLERAANGEGLYSLQASASTQYHWRLVGPYACDTPYAVAWHPEVRSICLTGRQASVLAHLLIGGWITKLRVTDFVTVTIASLVLESIESELVLDFGVKRGKRVLKNSSITF